MPYPNSQHIVPQFYLRNFSDNSEKIFASRKVDNVFTQPFQTKVSNALAINKYYESKYADSNSTRYVRRSSVENGLSEIERKIAPHISDFLKSISRIDGLSFYKDIIDNLPFLMALFANLLVRNPGFLDGARQEVRQSILSMEQNEVDSLATYLGVGESPERVCAEVESLFLHSSLLVREESPMQEVLNWLSDASTMILIAPIGTQFVVTNLPIALGWESQEDKYPTQAYMPLSSGVGVLYHYYGQGIKVQRLTPKDVMMWNQALLDNGVSDFVVGRYKSRIKQEIDRYNREHNL